MMNEMVLFVFHQNLSPIPVELAKNPAASNMDQNQCQKCCHGAVLQEVLLSDKSPRAAYTVSKVKETVPTAKILFQKTIHFICLW